MTGSDGETKRVQRLYDEGASRYDKLISFSEKLLFGDGRRWVCSQARGEVLEIAIGTGRNLPYYPEGVRLTGVELSPAMLEVARLRAQELGRDVDLRVGDAQALEFPDERFDAVVCTLSLCTIPDDRKTVAEARRVLRPGGRLLSLEHVRSPIRAVRAVQQVLDPVFVRFGADHLLREPLGHVEAEGLEVDWLERSKWGIIERLSARKPGQASS
jgi:ubiquinone/menaquinone biosynthesis C-methylase UbiE